MRQGPIVDDPIHWRRRADEARKIAAQLDDPIAQQTMLEIATSYDQLGALAAAKHASKD
jgi:hypothetical protein